MKERPAAVGCCAGNGRRSGCGGSCGCVDGCGDGCGVCVVRVVHVAVVVLRNVTVVGVCGVA